MSIRIASSCWLSEQVRFVDDDDGGAAAFGLFRGEGVGGLGGEGGGVEAGDPAEGGDDVVQHPADPDGRVGQVDGDVPGGVQRGGRGADGDGFPGADLTGDDAEGVLVDAPGDPGDGFAVAGGGGAACPGPGSGRTASW